MQNLALPILMFAALGLMMFFGMRKQKRQVAETKRMQDTVQPGARIMTTSGLHGTVTAVADDTIELEIAPGVRTTWVRAAVREVIVPVNDDSTVELDEDESRPSDVG
jgi:preprotein translocase subunit YajC